MKCKHSCITWLAAKSPFSVEITANPKPEHHTCKISWNLKYKERARNTQQSLDTYLKVRTNPALGHKGKQHKKSTVCQCAQLHCRLNQTSRLDSQPFIQNGHMIYDSMTNTYTISIRIFIYQNNPRYLNDILTLFVTDMTEIQLIFMDDTQHSNGIENCQLGRQRRFAVGACIPK